ncbi:hypothetical protein JCM5353_006802 [Sporobolomyces roseus]
MSFNLDSEVRLSSTNADRERLDELATLYGLIVSLDYLERAYVCASVLEVVDSVQISHEIGRRISRIPRSVHAGISPLHRLNIGVPATVEHEDGSHSGASSAGEHSKWVAETTQNFITFMDALKLKLRAKDQLHPLLTDLMSGYTRFKASNEWEGRPKILHWYVCLLLPSPYLKDCKLTGFYCGVG